jgi:DNA-binding transcriptional ArsR family regulator
MSSEDDLWRALSSPWRRRLLDLLRAGPRTTGDLADALAGLTRYAVMQHLGVLAAADLVVVERRGRHRYNHLNPVPLRRWYERWVVPLTDSAATEMLALERAIGEAMETTRTVRIETELRFAAPPAKVFAAITGDTLAWFPHSYGEDRTLRVVMEPRVGGAHYEDWGDGRGHLYGQVTEWDPPRRVATRGRVMPGSIMDTVYEITGDSVLRMTKVVTGPMTDEEAAGVQRFGDIANCADALRAVIEKD